MAKKEKPQNLLAKAARLKTEAQSTGKKKVPLGQDLSSQFNSSRGNSHWRPTKPGGRNGQGKP